MTKYQPKPGTDLVPGECSTDQIEILDYRPSLKHCFYELAGPWLLEVLNGRFEIGDEFTLKHPDEAYIRQGGFCFYARMHETVAGCVALKRLDDERFEFAKLYIRPDHRQSGLATRLIKRCISRCRENAARELWLQTTLALSDAHRLYDKLGFEDRTPPASMEVMHRTEKIMCLDLS